MHEKIIQTETSFNIHIEREKGGFLALYRRTAGERFMLVHRFPNGKVVVDMDVYAPEACEYKVVSESAMLRCDITMGKNGGSVQPEQPEVVAYTVDDLLAEGYLVAYGNENEGYRIDTAMALPMDIETITDFDDVFVGRKVPSSVDTARACVFNLADSSHLTEKQQMEVIAKFHDVANDRSISELLFRNYNLPESDLYIIQDKATIDQWQYCHEMFAGSTFHNIMLGVRGSISSANKLFKNLTCNELEIYTDGKATSNAAPNNCIAPHDTTDMFNGAIVAKYPRGISYHRALSNWTFTNSWNASASEIPDVRGITSEVDRMHNPYNRMKLPSGMLYQTMWMSSSLTRVAPVLDVSGVTGLEYLWGNCALNLPNVTDIRIYGINNIDWDFSAKGTDKAYIPMMDVDSIIYCLENATKLAAGVTHTVAFGDANAEELRLVISSRLIREVNAKGWRVFIGGEELIALGEEPEDLTFVAEEDGLTISLSSKEPYEYRIDGGGWNGIQASESTPAVSTGQRVSVRGSLTPINSSRGIGTFSLSAKCSAEGTPMSMLYGNRKIQDTVPENAFIKLFDYTIKLTKVSKDFLPATTIFRYGYRAMFYNSGIEEAPDLPATTMDYGCYYEMFWGCENLSTAPALPANALTEYCYHSMFKGCKSLVAAPNLPATTLAGSCYRSMFEGCSSLTSTPVLPASDLVFYCYLEMFRGCTSLTTAPQLPATNLGNGSYQRMFYGCTSLKSAPELPATTLRSSCYSGMFLGCTSLETAPVLPATSMATNCYEEMFYGCTSLKSAPELPATTLATYCYTEMFRGCTSLTSAPNLQSTWLYSHCYYRMFMGCVNLTTAPEIKASNLNTYSCQEMFYGCSKLSYIKAMFTIAPSAEFTTDWVYGVAPSGTFVKNEAATWDVTGVNGIPEGWTVETASA